MTNITSMIRILRKLHTRQPLALSYNVTHHCNMKCIMCNIYQTKIKDLSINQLKKILIDLKKSGFEIVEVTGGEPFIRKDIFSIFDILEELDLRFTINTNGTLLTKAICERLRNYPGILQIALSLDSLKRDVFTRLRGVDKLSETLSGLDRLITAQIGRPIKINLTLNRFNYKEIPEFLTFCRERDLFLSVFPVNLGSDFRHRSFDESLIPNELERREMASLFHMIASQRKKGELFWEHSHFYEGAISYLTSKWVAPCDAGQLFFDLHADGKIAVCNDLPPFGDLNRESFADCLKRLPSQQNKIKHCYQNHPCYYTCTYAISSIARHKISYLLENFRMMGFSKLIKNFIGNLQSLRTSKRRQKLDKPVNIGENQQ